MPREKTVIVGDVNEIRAHAWKAGALAATGTFPWWTELAANVAAFPFIFDIILFDRVRVDVDEPCDARKPTWTGTMHSSSRRVVRDGMA